MSLHQFNDIKDFQIQKFQKQLLKRKKNYLIYNLKKLLVNLLNHMKLNIQNVN